MKRRGFSGTLAALAAAPAMAKSEPEIHVSDYSEYVGGNWVWKHAHEG